MFSIINICVTCRAGTANPSGATEVTLSFCGIRIARSLVVCVMFCRSSLSFFPFSLGHYVVCPSFFNVRFLVTPLVSCGHCVVCPSFFDLRFLVTPSVSCGHCVVCPSFFDLRFLVTSLVSSNVSFLSLLFFYFVIML